MIRAGEKLKLARDRLQMRYREVLEASSHLAEKYGNDDYKISLGVLSSLESGATTPTIYKLYSLCVIYRLDILEVLQWYGADAAQLPMDSMELPRPATHEIGFGLPPGSEVNLPLSLEPGIDLNKTTFVSRQIQRWGKFPLMILNRLDLAKYRYGLIGMDDRRMIPLIYPGALVLIDDTKRKIRNTGWSNEQDRPVYFLIHRDGYICSFCTLLESTLIVEPASGSGMPAEVFRFPEQIELIGQVIGVATYLHPGPDGRPRA